MNLLGHVPLGICILFLLAVLVAVKRAATGTVLDRPGGNVLVQVVNIFNLLFLLIVNPLAAILLLTHRLETLDPAQVKIQDPLTLMILEIAGLTLYVAGFLLMAWALIRLARNYQLGGSAPRTGDSMITDGPYKLVRHPMYTAALSISLGLSFLVQSWIFLLVFFVYLALILLLIPMEEERLMQAYGESYLAYRQKTGRLVPFTRNIPERTASGRAIR